MACGDSDMAVVTTAEAVSINGLVKACELEERYRKELRKLPLGTDTSVTSPLRDEGQEDTSSRFGKKNVLGTHIYVGGIGKQNMGHAHFFADEAGNVKMIHDTYDPFGGKKANRQSYPKSKR